MGMRTTLPPRASTMSRPTMASAAQSALRVPPDTGVAVPTPSMSDRAARGACGHPSTDVSTWSAQGQALSGDSKIRLSVYSALRPCGGVGVIVELPPAVEVRIEPHVDRAAIRRQVRDGVAQV